MPRARLFGYSVDEEDGRLVITVDGALAETAIRHIREGAEAGKGGQILSQILPIHSVYKLMSAAEEKGDELTLEELLGQNVDQSLAAFEEQLNELKGAIEGYEPPTEGPKTTRGR